jgi:hypothetical protein
MVMMSGEGEAQIIFLARDGSTSSNHVRGRSELDNFEKEPWSIAGRRHFPVIFTIFHIHLSRAFTESHSAITIGQLKVARFL